MIIFATIPYVLRLDPADLGKTIENNIFNKAKNLLNGKYLKPYGYILYVVDAKINMVDKNSIIDVDSGSVNFNVFISAFMLRPFIEEYIVVKIQSIVKEGIFGKYGLIDKVFIHSTSIMQAGYYFDDSSKVWKKNDSEDDVLKPGFFIQVQVNTVGIEDNQRISCVAKFYRALEFDND